MSQTGKVEKELSYQLTDTTHRALDVVGQGEDDTYGIVEDEISTKNEENLAMHQTEQQISQVPGTIQRIQQIVDGVVIEDEFSKSNATNIKEIH